MPTAGSESAMVPRIAFEDCGVCLKAVFSARMAEKLGVAGYYARLVRMNKRGGARSLATRRAA